MKEIEIQEMLNLLATPKKIGIIPHRNPDGDAIGSTLALCQFLKKLNHLPIIVAPNEFPEFLSWLPGANEIVFFEKDKKYTTEILQNCELIFTLDFNALHRVGDLEPVLQKLEIPFVMIDHHQKPDAYAAITFSDTQYGSTCQMVYHFIEYLGHKNLIDKTIATCIYVGIVTDSGSFRFPKTTSLTHHIVAELISLGVENTKIHSLLFENNSYNSLQLLGKALQNMQIIAQKNTAFITLTQEELDRFNFVKGDTEGLVNYGLSIKGIKFAAIFIENKADNMIKISFRSKGEFDVNQFARTHFEGGGHINAAGGKSDLTLVETVEKFQTILSTINIDS